MVSWKITNFNITKINMKISDTKFNKLLSINSYVKIKICNIVGNYIAKISPHK